MKLIRELMEYCDARGMLTGEQYKELATLCGQSSSNDWGAYDDYDDEYYLYNPWPWEQNGQSETGEEIESLIALLKPDGKQDSRRAKTFKTVRAKLGAVMKLPALGEWLKTRFCEELAASRRDFDAIFLIHRAAGLQTNRDASKRDWPELSSVLNDLDRLKHGELQAAFENELTRHSRDGLSLNQLCRSLCYAPEMELDDAQGPAIDAYRRLMGLKRQTLPVKLRWILRNNAVAIAYKHKMVKFKVADCLAQAWKTKRDMLETACLRPFLPITKGMGVDAISQYSDTTALDMFGILWEGERLLHGSSEHRLHFRGMETYFAELTWFRNASMATALLVDERATLAMLKVCQSNRL